MKKSNANTRQVPTGEAAYGGRVFEGGRHHQGPEKSSEVIARAIERSGLGYDSFVRIITKTALGRMDFWTITDLERVLLVAERAGLDPLGQEIFLAPNRWDPGAASQVVVTVDGWSRLLNAHPAFDGIEFQSSQAEVDGVPEWMECTIHRRDRRAPTTVREYLCEARNDHVSWLTHPRRMLRHKALSQCARLCLGLSGVCDGDYHAEATKASAPARPATPANTRADAASSSCSDQIKQKLRQSS